VHEFLAAEARGEVEWLTTEQVEAFDRELIAAASMQGRRRQKGTHP
jgi:hypothetical protein